MDLGQENAVSQDGRIFDRETGEMLNKIGRGFGFRAGNPSDRWRRRWRDRGERLLHDGHRGPAGRGRASKEGWKGQDLVIVETGPAPGESYGMDRGERRGGRHLDGAVEAALVWTA